MPRRRRTRTIVAVLTAIAAVAALNAVLSWRPLARSTTTESLPAAGLREVRIDTSGAVRLEVGSVDQVTVEAIRTWTFRRPSTTRSSHDGVLDLHGGCPKPGLGGCAVAYHVVMPAGLAAVVTTHGDGIRAVGIDGGSLEASSSGGGITASFTKPPSRVSVRSSGGGIDLTVPAGSYRVDAQSSGGGVRVDVIQDPDAANVLIVHSSGGGIRIRRG